jgi:beta-galactosidase beta subunit
MEKKKVNFEAHRNFNDLQYVIAGAAEMGVAAITGTSVKVKVAYFDSTDTEVFTITKGDKYYKAGNSSCRI